MRTIYLLAPDGRAVAHSETLAETLVAAGFRVVAWQEYRARLNALAALKSAEKRAKSYVQYQPAHSAAPAAG